MFENKYYFDKCLPMGASISYSLYDKFFTVLYWCTEIPSGNRNILHYLDEIVYESEANSVSVCEGIVQIFRNVYQLWGFL